MQKEIRENTFYKQYYAQIKNTETELLSQIKKQLDRDTEKSGVNLVEHIASRIKSSESTIEKLELAGYEPTEENAIRVLSDVIGIRLIVHFMGDIYTIRNLLVNSGQFTVVKEKDYIIHAKPTGYRGYHIIVETNFDGFKIRAEIQLRTIAMDCWASLEHEIRYKKGIRHTDLINYELKKCADDLLSADIAMEQIWSMVKEQESDSSALEDMFIDSMVALQNVSL